MGIMLRYYAVQGEVMQNPEGSLPKFVKRHGLSWFNFQRVAAAVGDEIYTVDRRVKLKIRSVYPEHFEDHIETFLNPALEEGYDYEEDYCEEDDDDWGCDDRVEAEIERLNDKDD